MWNKKDDNLLTGLLVGSLLFGGKKKNGEQEGCLSKIGTAVLTIIGLFSAFIAGINYHSLIAGIIAFFAVPLVIYIILLVLKSCLGHLFSKNKAGAVNPSEISTEDQSPQASEEADANENN